jgi:hypothetical protein
MAFATDVIHQDLMQSVSDVCFAVLLANSKLK